MAPNHCPGNVSPEFSQRHWHLLHAALKELGCSLDELSSRNPEPDVTRLLTPDKYQNHGFTSTSTQSLSGNDASAYHTDDDESADGWTDTRATGRRIDTYANSRIEVGNYTQNRVADQVTDNSNGLNVHNTDLETESWLHVVDDLAASSFSSGLSHNDPDEPDCDLVPSATSLDRQAASTIVHFTPDAHENSQRVTPLASLDSRSTAELSLVGVGDIHQDHYGHREIPIRVATANSQDVIHNNHGLYTTFNSPVYGSPVEHDDNIRASQDAHCIRPPWATTATEESIHKKIKLDHHTETPESSNNSLTPILTPDAHGLSEPSILARSNKACLRCRFQHLKCVPDPSNPNGPCLKCKELKRSTSFAQQCWPIILAEAHLYREQHMPNMFHTRRWESMSMKNIETWASDEIKVIRVGHVAMNKSYTLKVRRYVPVDGDMIDERWVVNGVARYHKIPPYAIANMDEAADMFDSYITENIDAYMAAFVSAENPLLHETYKMAWRHRHTAATAEERKLMKDVLRLWVCCRKTSNPERIVGDERLGVEDTCDVDSPWYNTSPIPPMMIAQMQCIFYSKFLRPLRKQVLDGLWNILKKQRKSWFTVYLTMFVLSHSCSQITRRNYEFARACGLSVRYFNPVAIIDHQEGCNILLSHFHYINKGVSPFYHDTNSPTFKNFIESASLNQDQAHFIQWTALWVQQDENRFLREWKTLPFEHDLYWVSQLFDPSWKRAPTYGIS